MGILKKLALLTLAVILVLGCVKGGPRYTYEDVYVSYIVESTPKATGWRIAEYMIKDNYMEYRLIGWKDEVIMSGKGNISSQESINLGKTIVDSGFYGLADDMISRTSGITEEEAMAALSVDIDGYNKTVVIKPYEEQYVSGNIRKIVFEVKRLAQNL